MREKRHERQVKFTNVQKSLAEACMAFSNPTSYFVNLIGMLGFRLANRNFTQAVRIYFMVYVYMHSTLRVWGKV